MAEQRMLTKNRAKPGQRKIALQAPVYLVLDVGNSVVKVVVMDKLLRWNCVTYPHALKRIPSGKFDEQVSRRTRGLSRGADLKLDTFVYERSGYEQAFTVGEAAEIGLESRQTGGAKYKTEYYAPLFIPGLLDLLPDGHDNIEALALFPPGDFRHTEDLIEVVGGKHKVTKADGTTVTYRIRSVAIADEPVGGLNNYLLAADGLHYRTNNIPDGMGLCFDLGGKISSGTPFDKHGNVSYANSPSYDLGIQDAMKTFSDIVLASNKFTLTSGKNIDARIFESYRGSNLPQDGVMREAFLDNIYRVSGYELNVKDIVDESVTGLLNQARQMFTQNLGGSQRYQYVVVTGGGGGILFDRIIKNVFYDFNLDRIFLANTDSESVKDTFKANVLGARKMFAGALQSE